MSAWPHTKTCPARGQRCGPSSGQATLEVLASRSLCRAWEAAIPRGLEVGEELPGDDDLLPRGQRGPGLEATVLGQLAHLAQVVPAGEGSEQPGVAGE